MKCTSAAAIVVLLALSDGARAAPNLPAPISPAAPSPSALGPPMLHLSAWATVKVQPDELAASLQGVGIASTAILAQRHVNELMVKAKAVAAGAAAVKTSFQGYSAEFTDEKPPHWTAQQIVELRGAEGEQVLDLVGRLQGIGLAIKDLGWQVSPDRAERARQSATVKALTSLRIQAADAAAALGMEVDHIQSVALDELPRVVPFARGGAFTARAVTAGLPAPNASRENLDVTATATADVVLRAVAATKPIP
jgi:uncharacterized protein YggE